MTAASAPTMPATLTGASCSEAGMPRGHGLLNHSARSWVSAKLEEAAASAVSASVDLVNEWN